MFLRAMERPRWSRWAIYSVVLAAAGAANLIAVCVAAGHLVIVLWDFCQRTVRVGGDGTAESGKALPGGRLAPEGSPAAARAAVLRRRDRRRPSSSRRW